MSIIRKGAIIRGPAWPESVEVKLAEEQGKYLHIIGATTSTRQHVDQLIPLSEMDRYTTDRDEKPFAEEAWKVFLALETLRYRFASLYDPLLAVNTSKVDPLPHQIEAVYGYILKLPRIRFLIADDPGAGKTIMAGLIIKELKLRRVVQRTLVVAPGHLKDQWRRELSERFAERFIVIDRGIMDSLYGENPWEREAQIITSIDFAKREEILPSIAAARFDLIIVDEAHKMSASRYGDKIEKTDRYRLGETLSRIAEHLLFLTATPHQGDPESFRLFLDLLEKGFFATNEMVHSSITNKDNPLFIRRIKEDLKDFEGKPLFLPRHVTTLSYDLGRQSPQEKVLYNELSEYVVTQYNRVLARDKKRNIAFALVILQRRFASSVYALLRSLERRKERLEGLLSESLERLKPSEGSIDFEEAEDLSEEERWKEEEIWETLSVAENRGELEQEISTLGTLIGKAKEILSVESEIKLVQLKKTVHELAAAHPSKEDRKILIFTESRDTLEYLERKLKVWGFSTNSIHGGMRLEERVAAEKIFRNETDVMVATEAAGEGINLQFCSLMINYDIPWNPNRLEQRMGRIHRYLQQKEVSIYNLVASDTREGQVLHKLFAKLQEIRRAMGSDKVFDVISDVLPDTNLAQLLVEAAANARSMDEILASMDVRVDETYIKRVKENLGESLATHFIDYTRIKEMAAKARELRLIPEYTENYFRKAVARAGGNLREAKGGFLSLDSVPHQIRKVSDQRQIPLHHGELLRRYPRLTFDKDVAIKNPEAEFVCFGHPLFEAVMAWVESTCSEAIQHGTVFEDPDRRMDGFILFFDGEIKDGTGDTAGRRLFAFYADRNNVVHVPPSILWDLAESQAEGGETCDRDSLVSQASVIAIDAMESYRDEISAERARQAQIKRKYGVKSLEDLIVRLDGELIALQERKERGDNVDVAIRAKEERKGEYERSLTELTVLLEREVSLTMSMPRFLGMIRVKPSQETVEGTAGDEEIERIGMETVMSFERSQGRKPEDVSKDNLGFDIRSRDSARVARYIEVKARAEIGPVALTQNEWFKAKRFGEDYWLYAVMNAASAPEVFPIQNPAATLQAEERVEAVRYVIKADQIVKAKG